jgi:cytochrome P450 family 619
MSLLLATQSIETTMAMEQGEGSVQAIQLAERSIFLLMAKILWDFDVSPGKDHAGKILMPDISPEKGCCEAALICAYDFPAVFKVRGRGKETSDLT